LPDFPQKKYPFTTRQLAGHRAGLRDYNENDLSDLVRTEHFQNATEALRIIQNDTLLFQPGSQFHYSTFGWIVIGAVIEEVCHQNYLDYMTDQIWRPLNMANTCGDDVTRTIPHRAKFYDEVGQENDYGDLSYKYAGGGLLSTAEDLSLFGNELLNGKRFDADLKKMMFTSQRTLDKKETGYGLGWYIGHDKNGNRIWHHAGDLFSSSSNLILYPDHNIVISFVGNSQAGAAFDLQKIVDLILN
jgi:CubicO group peptidase (beta-lactamase class C family)